MLTIILLDIMLKITMGSNKRHSLNFCIAASHIHRSIKSPSILYVLLRGGALSVKFMD